MSNLKQKAASGMIWTALQKYSMMFISFIADIILARLLTPYDYGCVGMLSIFLVLSETFVDAGFGTALIQKKQTTDADYSTVFFWNLGISSLLYVVLFFSAPFIADFFNIQLLCPILRVQGLILFIQSFKIIQVSQLKKNLNFKPWSIAIVASHIIALCVAILMAYNDFGVWSLVVRHLLAAFLVALILWMYVRWWPRLVFSWQSFKELFGFGFYIFLSHLVTRASTSIQGLMIGKFYNAAALGYYSKAEGTEGMASKSISNVLDQVTYPLYAEVQDDLAAMRNMVKRLTMTISYVMFPMLFLLILVAKPLFILLYTEKWLPCVPFFQVLCLAGLGQCLQSVNFQTISAIGKSKVTFVWTFVKRGVTIGLMVGGLALWGMKGLLIGVVINNWFAYMVNVGLVSKYIGYKWWRQLLDLTPVLICSILIAVVSWFMVDMLHLSLYIDGIVKVCVFCLLYMGWSMLFKPEAYVYTKGIAEMVVGKYIKRRQKR